MFVNNINPTLLTLGPFEIRYYGIIYALGFVLIIYFLRYFTKKGYINLSEQQISDLVFWLVIGIVGGARIFEVLFWNPSYYFAHPLEIPAVWNGGLSFHGAVAGAIVVVYYFSKKYKINMLRLMDLLTIPAALGTALGRIGNFLNSELYGTATQLPWCVKFTKVDDLCRHPYQIYSFFMRTLLFGYLFYINGKKHKDGYIFWNFIFWFGLVRFFLDFTRADELYLGISIGQWLSVVMVLIGGYALFKNYWKVKF